MSTTNLNPRRRRLYAALLVMPDVDLRRVSELYDDLHDGSLKETYSWFIYVRDAPGTRIMRRLHTESWVVHTHAHTSMPFDQLLSYIINLLGEEAIDSIEATLESMGRYTP